MNVDVHEWLNAMQSKVTIMERSQIKQKNKKQKKRGLFGSLFSNTPTEFGN